MSFINLTPDVNPDGSRFQASTTPFGVRYFYFTFVPTSSSISVFLARNIYRNEEVITRVFTAQSSNSILTNSNVSNVILPCTFINGQIGLFTPSGSRYQNNSNTPNFFLNNLVVGNTYILESRTIYNDPGSDFSAIVKGRGGNLITLIYVLASLLPTTPVLPIPLPPMPMPQPLPPLPQPSDLPPAPTALTAVNVITGVSLTWNAIPQVTSYTIYREGLLLSSSLTSDYIDTQVISGNPYSYKVSAVNNVGEGMLSSPISITPIFMFTNVVPNRTPSGNYINDSNVRFYYYLFTPVTSSIDVFFYNIKSANQKAVVGIYDTTAPNSNIFLLSNISKLDSNVAFGLIQVGNITLNGLRFISNGTYTNLGVNPNFRINLPSLDLTTSATVLKTYIFEIASYKNSTEIFTPDLGLYFKNVSSDSLSSYTTQLIYNSVSITRAIPSPYIIMYDFSRTSDADYTNYIYPNIFIFQNVINVLESIITTTHNARAPRSKNDMLVHFTIMQLSSDVLGESVLDKWKVDTVKSPNFTYEQSISFNSDYFTNGYLVSPANFNGSSTVNNIPNITLFNVLLHEMIHGIGIFYNDSFNNTSSNVGWNPNLTNVSDNTPWYLGPIGSSALASYRSYCNNQNLQRIPIEDNYGPGTALSHWDEGDAPKMPMDYRYFNGVYQPALKYEIMTGFINKNEYMTGLTSGALKDYGYNVNLVCPYVVAHPFTNLVPMIDNTDTKINFRCMSIPDSNAIKHKIVIEKPLTQQHYSVVVRQIGYVKPVYFYLR